MRGEPERVAERVRQLLADHPPEALGRPGAPEPPGSVPAPGPPEKPEPGDPLAWSLPSGPLGPPDPLVAPERPGAHRTAPRLRDRWAARLPVRVDPGRRGTVALAAVVVVAAALTGAWVLTARPSALPVSSSAAGTSGAGASASAAAPPGASGSQTAAPTAAPAAGPGVAATPGPAALLVVDVAGKVRRPGLYRLPAGARVDDALRAAGGALPGVRLDRLNLAARVVDGQQVAVGVAPAPDAGGAAPAGSGGGGAPASASGPVDLNSATAQQLQTLPGVGPVLAQHIIDWRSAHGRFSSVGQLNDVTGIGDVKFAALKPLVTV